MFSFAGRLIQPWLLIWKSGGTEAGVLGQISLSFCSMRKEFHFHQMLMDKSAQGSSSHLVAPRKQGWGQGKCGCCCQDNHPWHCRGVWRWSRSSLEDFSEMWSPNAILHHSVCSACGQTPPGEGNLKYLTIFQFPEEFLQCLKVNSLPLWSVSYFLLACVMPAFSFPSSESLTSHLNAR